MSGTVPRNGDTSRRPGAPAATEFAVDVTGTEGVRAARHHVEQEVLRRGAVAVVDDAALVAAELLANAAQHGRPPVAVTVSGTAQCVRIEVRDANPRPPVRPATNHSNMTGRGLALVEALATGWGVERAADGKVVWVEFAADRSTADHAAPDVDAILSAWADDPPTSEPRYDVVLGDVPTDLLIAAKAHVDNLVREFSLASSGAAGAIVPEHLSRLIETVVHGFAEARDAIKRQALRAAHRGEVRTRLVLRLPLSAADAGERYLAALDEADTYSRAMRLLTLETPAAHRIFRQWYVGAVVSQLRALADGQQPDPVMPFETLLLGEVERLAAVQRVTDRAARLQRVTAALARARTPEDVASVVLAEAVSVLGADGGSLLLPAADGRHLTVPGAVGYGSELVDAMREERLDAPLPAATAIRTGTAVWLESRDARDALFPELHGFEASTIAMCAVPLVVGDRAIGALRFSFSTRRLFDEDERAFVLALATQTAQTLHRTEVYAAQRAASLQMQRALLPEGVPIIPGFDVAAYYSPAGGEEAGGDFYDVFPLPGGRCVAVVGDVMGRGVEAAASMAQLRTTVRAYAIDDPSPDVVLARVDGFFARFDVTQLATVLYCLVDPATGTVTIGNAGHLPPLLVDAAGARVLLTNVGTPLGVDAGGRETTVAALEPGASLVAFTDGLVERRGEDIDRGVLRLLAATRQRGDRDVDSLLDAVVGSMSGTAHDDDVTALVLRRR